jgi:GNAT superfamily N-acetyltransferase
VAIDDLSVDFEPFIAEEVRKHIIDGLIDHNTAATGISSHFPANFVLRSARGEVLGGLLGMVWGGWLQVKILWVSQVVRGEGHGARLLGAAEAYARERACIGVNLDTFSFQARPFYERLGYTVVATHQDYPVGHERYFLEKRLT